MKIGIGSFVFGIAIGVTVGAVLVIAGIPHAPAIAGGVTPFVIGILSLFEKSKKTIIANQQTQIDNLTRELNEIKQKLGQ